jgi:cytochrome c biogenesis protein CcdA/peroxiredoxin
VEITVGLALIAGFVSFISPCVLPLVPAYIGYMGGRMSSSTAHQQRTSASVQQRLNTFIHGLFFVIGFSFIFVTIGLLSTAFVQQVGGSNVRVVTDLIGRLGGILIIFFGLHFMGVLRSLFARLRQANLNQPLYILLLGLILTLLILWGFNGDVAFPVSYVWEAAPLLSIISVVLVLVVWGWLILGQAFAQPGAFIARLLDGLERALYSDTRRTMTASTRGNYVDSVIMGVIFSAGWTPCIGPVYGAVLTMAANGGDVGQAALLLAMYSLGLGVPFLLTALLLDGVQVWLKRLQRHMGTIERVSGAFLVLIGVMVATGQLQSLSQQFAGDFAEFSIGVEEQVIQLVTGTEITSIDTDATVQTTSSDQPPAEEIGLEVGKFAPDFQTVTAEGEPIALSDLRGSVVLLNFWATWCGPCRIEMPGFQRQYMTYRDQGLVILAVNNAESLDIVTAFRDQLRLTFPIAMDESGDIQRQFGIVNYPSTLLIDRDGRIAARHFGVVAPADVQAMLSAIGFLS